MDDFLAWRIATGEAFARQRVSRARGRQSAIEAELVFDDADGTPRFYLMSHLTASPVSAATPE
jgi:hypothetical protein